ncbi:MAG: Uma2 family endonuclease [Planctomycetota bacterium]|nr:Uma2 family endonuclease [Planctomycetota bacterium]
MELVVTDPDLRERLIAERQASGGDRFDEVWEGTYVMAPLANDEHQGIQTGLAAVFQIVVGWPGAGLVRAGVNVSDREEGWEHNYRCPDVVVILNGTSARNCNTHWVGGPDFAVEVRSRGDRTPQKLPFYASVNVRELLVIERHPWFLELYRLADGELAPVGRCAAGDSETLNSEVLPLSFRLIPASPRPTIEVTHQESGQHWSI